MLRYAASRLAIAIPLLFAIILILFLMLKAAPGDPVSVIIGNFPAPPEYREQIIERYNLDDPLWVQFWAYLGSLITGDFGYSFANGAPVMDIIMSRLPATLLLVVLGIALGSVLGIVVGLISGRTTNPGVDTGVNTLVLIAFAIPSFWLAQLLVMFFALQLGWFPTSGLSSAGPSASTWEAALNMSWHLVLPVLALGIVDFAAIARIMRASTAEVASQDYIVTAQLKRVKPWRITTRHVFRNASLPVVTVIGYRFGQALAGVLLIEKVFGYPGMGQLLEQSILKRDNQTILGIVVLVAVMVVVINLLTDLLYGFLDPRIRRA